MPELRIKAFQASDLQLADGIGWAAVDFDSQRRVAASASTLSVESSSRDPAKSRACTAASSCVLGSLPLRRLERAAIGSQPTRPAAPQRAH